MLLVIYTELAYCQEKVVITKRVKGKATGGQSYWENERELKAKSKTDIVVKKVSLFQKDVTEGGEEEIEHPQLTLIKKLEGESVMGTDGNALPQRRLLDVPISPGSKTTTKMWVKVDDEGNPILS
jgi:hypothetical protein